MKLYIANKMSGLGWFNFPWFFETERKAWLNGWEPINPAAMDLARGFNAYDLPFDSDWNMVEADMSWEDLLAFDEGVIRDHADAIYMGNLWKQSKGAKREYRTAKKKRIPILFEKDGFFSPEEVFDARI